MSKKLPDISTHFSDWYNQIVYEAELADHSPVRGCVVIRPYGWSVWENIKDVLNKKIIATGHQNAQFPLLIPLSFLEKEAEHVKGFSPELAVVTHAGGKELEEKYVVRPTSETIIHYMFARWIKSWRDLPLKINQWANVMRWEMRTRPFLRTSEFYWQEGHTAHQSEQEAHDEALMMLNQYKDLIQHHLAIPFASGIKSEHEKFAGADKTYTIECIMQDGKALQMCTSHLISRNFAKAFGIQFQNQEGSLDWPYLTSWGATTRLIGATVMVHGDQKGLVLPPNIAPIQVVIIPIYKAGLVKEPIAQAARALLQQLSPVARVHIDADEVETPGAKFYKWELKGVPIRIELGPRDLDNGTIVVSDRLGLAKETVPVNKVIEVVQERLRLVQHQMYERALARFQKQWHTGEKLAEFGGNLAEHGGFYQTGWCKSYDCEQKLKEYQASIRCLLDQATFAHCFACNKPSVTDVLVAKSY